MKNIFPGKQVTAVNFGFDGSLWAGTYDTKATLYKIDSNSQKSSVISVPIKNGDAAYIAINPKNNDEMAIATFNKDICLSKNGGGSWVKVVNQGKGINST